MTQTIYQVDAFTDRPFAGNPAGVCILPEPANEAWMQAVAREMNFSETAFLVHQAEWFQSSLVHTRGRGQVVRTCHPGKCPHSVANRHNPNW